MKKKSRTILFLVCLFLFALITPSIVLYSQGYRPDFENKKLARTGGFFFKVLPKQATIYLNGELVKKTDLFFGSALIDNLLPKKYEVEVKKDGYHSWIKNLEIKEREVTDAKNIVLFPENPNFAVLTKAVKNLWLSPDQSKIILQKEDKNGWALKLYETDKNIKSHLVKEKDFSSQKNNLFDLEFSPDSKAVSLEIGTAETIKYFTLEIDKTPAFLEETTPPPLPANVLTYQKINNDIYYLDSSGSLWKTDVNLTAKQKILEKSFPVKQETEYELRILGDNVFLQESQTLYWITPQSKSFEKLFEPIKILEISPDGKKIAYCLDYEIWVLYLKDEGLERKAGDKIFLMRFSEKINDCLWLTSHYLVFNAGETIKASEIDNRDRINIADIGKFKNPDMLWNSIRKELYILSEGNLYKSDKLVP